MEISGAVTLAVTLSFLYILSSSSLNKIYRTIIRNTETLIKTKFSVFNRKSSLNLPNNRFTGEIPSSVANINALEALDLSQNMLSGKIPGKFRSLPFSEKFNVSHNRLVGPIPQGL